MNNIKKFRGIMGISQQELADRTGITRVSISSLENGKNHKMSEKNAVIIAKALNCSPIELLGADILICIPKNDEERIFLIKNIANTITDPKVKESIFESLR